MLASLLALLVGSCGGGGGGSTATPEPPRANAAPTANPGNVRSVAVGETVTLDGSASNDPDGDELSYRWTIFFAPPNSASAIGSANGPRATLLIDQPGIYGAALKVEDGRGGSHESSVVVTTLARGHLVDRPVAGVEYRSGDTSGVTDASGGFDYPLGTAVEFRIGGIILGSAPGNAMITLFDLAPGSDEASRNAVTNLARLLQTLDDDGIAGNGLQIGPAVRQAAANLSLLRFEQDPAAFERDPVVVGALSALAPKTQAGSRPLVSASSAMQHLNASVLAEMEGSYEGVLTGAEAGTWSIAVAADGSVAGAGTAVPSGPFSVTGRTDPRGPLEMTFRFPSRVVAVEASLTGRSVVSGSAGANGQEMIAISGARAATGASANAKAQCGPTEYASIYADPRTLACDTDILSKFVMTAGPNGLTKFDFVDEKLVTYGSIGPCSSAPPAVADPFHLGDPARNWPPNSWVDANGIKNGVTTFADGCTSYSLIEDQWAFNPATPNLPARQAQCGGGFDQNGYKTFARKLSLIYRRNNIVSSCKMNECVRFDMAPSVALSQTTLNVPKGGGTYVVTVTPQPRLPATDTCRSWSVDKAGAPFVNVTPTAGPGAGTRRVLPKDIAITVPVNPGSERNGEIVVAFGLPNEIVGRISIIQADPTFIQHGALRAAAGAVRRPAASASDRLIARIVVPADGDLVRADVPVFGLAYGAQFKSYHVEIGAGAAPTQWQTIAQGGQAQTSVDAALNEALAVADMTVHGNLGNWDTGLKEYVYLPSYPKDHPTDLRGTHTLRLTVEGLDGKTVEDRVTVHAANVIPNAWGAKVTSHDGRFSLTVPEQALMDSFRLVLAQPADAMAVGIPQGKQLIGHVYEVREPGERFTKEVTLDMAFEAAELAGTDAGRVAIHGYNADNKRWEQLSSVQRRSGHALKASLRRLHAYYALLASDSPVTLTPMEPAAPAPDRPLLTVRTSDVPYLVRNDFERDADQWSNRDHEVGGTVSLDAASTFDGTKVLKITNLLGGGNFAVNVFNQPFDAREFPLVQFDYRIAAGVKTNFLVKVEGRWYEIRFTGDPRDLSAKRVNIAGIGDIEGIVSDDRWHTASFNLYDMLRTRTRHTMVEEMIMANWDVNGYMKLNFGKNTKGATYYIDNFAIRRDAAAGLQVRDERLLIDDFNQMKSTNALGGATTTFSSAAPEQVKAAFAPRDGKGSGHALRVDYDLAQPASYAGYVSALQRLDLRDYQVLTFQVSRSAADADLLVGLRDRSGHESKVRLSEYLPRRSSADWQRVSIPAAAFATIRDWAGIENLSLSFAHDLHSRGSVQIDDVAFEKELTQVAIDDFERADGKNSLGRERWTFASGAAAINGQVVHNSPNGVYRMAYGGNIGAKDAVTGELKSFAGWTASLGGIDCTRCDALNFRLRGAEGGEELTVYLSDGNFRWGVPLTKEAGATADWRLVSIPVQAFAEYGVDLTHLAELQFAFEGRETSKGERTSGTIYVDDIRFGPAAGQ